MNLRILRFSLFFVLVLFLVLPMEAKKAEVLGKHLGGETIVFNHQPPRSGKLKVKPYWLWYIAGGVGYEILNPQSTEVENLFSNRTPLLASSFTSGLLRAFGERFGASFNVDYGRRKERYSIPSQVANGSMTETSVAHFSNLSAMASVNYLVPTRGCDFQVYAGLGYSLLQDWTGDRIYRDLSTEQIAFNTASPYETKDVSNRFRYMIGTRAAKPVNDFFYLVFDTQVLIQSQYDVSDIGVEGFEMGNAVNVRLGVGYRLE